MIRLTMILPTIMMMSTCNGNVAKDSKVRPATQANRFYTGNASELSEEVDSFLALHAKDKQYKHVAALIVPHAGYYFSGNVAGKGIQEDFPAGAKSSRVARRGFSEHGT